MRIVLGAACATVLLASPALCQIPIPPHATIYNGLTRGFNFTATTPFFITELGLPMDAYQPGDTGSLLVRVNGNLVLRSVGNATANVPANIRINVADNVDVMGNWSPQVPGYFTAHNSYGNVPFTSTIEGVPHVIQRTGWQWDIGHPGWTTAAYIAPTGGQLGRVLMYTAPVTSSFANFSANVRQGTVPLTVNFTDTSFSSDPGGVTGWAWDFNGDSVIDSTLQNPTFVYGACGNYNVTLTVTDATNPPAVRTRTGFVQAGNTPIVPSFTHAPVAPGVIQFTDTSTPVPATWAWDFNGDSVVDSTVQNPVWSFGSPCAAPTVTLTATNTCSGPVTVSRNVAFAPGSQATVQNGTTGNATIGSGTVFDVQVTSPSGVVICALGTSLYSTTALLHTPVGCTVWVTDAAGGYASNHTNAAVWRQVATGTGFFAGGWTMTPVETTLRLSNPIYLPAGTFGMAIHITSGAGVIWTTLTAATTYAGPDLSIVCGGGKTAPFNTAITANRAFNGTLHYSTTASGAMAGYGFFGAGCAGSMGISRLSVDHGPMVGTTMTVTASSLPQSLGIMITGFSRTLSAVGPLPLSTAPFGAPGCLARVSPDATLFLLGAANSASLAFTVPGNSVLIGLQLFNQPVPLDPGFNALGATFGDAHAMVIGN